MIFKGGDTIKSNDLYFILDKRYKVVVLSESFVLVECGEENHEWNNSHFLCPTRICTRCRKQIMKPFFGVAEAKPDYPSYEKKDNKKESILDSQRPYIEEILRIQGAIKETQEQLGKNRLVCGNEFRLTQRTNKEKIAYNEGFIALANIIVDAPKKERCAIAKFHKALADMRLKKLREEPVQCAVTIDRKTLEDIITTLKEANTPSQRLNDIINSLEAPLRDI